MEQRWQWMLVMPYRAPEVDRSLELVLTRSLHRVQRGIAFDEGADAAGERLLVPEESLEELLDRLLDRPGWAGSARADL